MPKTVNRLTAITVGSLKTRGLYADGAGLYLKVTSTGSRSWVLRYMLKGRPRYLGLGSASAVSLAKARELAGRSRGLSLQGVDPIEQRKQEAAAARRRDAKAMTFRQCAEAFIAIHESTWKNAKHRYQWRNTMKFNAYPRLGEMIVNDIETEHVLTVLEPMWLKTPETASRVRGRIEMVLDWAKARGLREGENPARWRGHLANLLPKASKVAPVMHLPALPFDDLPAFLTDLRAVGGLAALALELLILTATRTSEARGVSWGEFDLKNKVWTIPASRMKSGKEHRIPLSDRAVEIVKELECIKHNDLVFPGVRPGRCLGKGAMLALLGRMNLGHITVHGFRSTFRDWAAETTNFPNFVVEMALAHSVESKVEAAYRRGDLFQKRRKLMDGWAAFCQRQSATVIRIAEQTR
jgi:integrase